MCIVFILFYFAAYETDICLVTLIFMFLDVNVQHIKMLKMFKMFRTNSTNYTNKNNNFLKNSIFQFDPVQKRTKFLHLFASSFENVLFCKIYLVTNIKKKFTHQKYAKVLVTEKKPDLMGNYVAPYKQFLLRFVVFYFYLIYL